MQVLPCLQRVQWQTRHLSPTLSARPMLICHTNPTTDYTNTEVISCFDYTLATHFIPEFKLEVFQPLTKCWKHLKKDPNFEVVQETYLRGLDDGVLECWLNTNQDMVIDCSTHGNYTDALSLSADCMASTLSQHNRTWCSMYLSNAHSST